MEAAGAFAIVLELIPAEVAKGVTEAIGIPTIGIGAGPHCDGEVQVFHDIVGLLDWFVPRHTRRYADVGAQMKSALEQYAADVRSRAFPADEHSISRPDLGDPDLWK